MSISKIFFTYWEGDQLSQLHYYTILSLQKLNPNSTNTLKIQWNSGEHKNKFNKTISFNDFNNIEIKKIDFEKEYSISESISCVFKADFVRIAKLYEHGGLWFDFDILFIKTIPEYLFNSNIDLYYFEYGETIPTGLILSTSRNILIEKLFIEATQIIKNMNIGNSYPYQILGPNLWNKIIKEFDTNYIQNNTICLPTSIIYPYIWNNIGQFFIQNNTTDLIQENTIGIHWYNGGADSKNYINSNNLDLNLNPNSSIVNKYLFQIKYYDILSQINATDYQCTLPFPYLMQDNFLNELFAKQLQNEILQISDSEWDRYDNPFEQKYTLRDKFKFPLYLTHLFNKLTSKEFVSELSNLTGVNLILDETRNFWGVHKYDTGDKLDIHLDADYHPTLLLKKEITLGIYLSNDWKEEYGCELEIWEGNKTSIFKKVVNLAPIFNRLIIFKNNDVSWHGNPEPANSPKDSKRIFVTLSYLCNECNLEEKNKRVKALFVARPDDIPDEEKDKLRLLRTDPIKYKEIYNLN